MFGPRITTVFRSRWRAVWWAATVLIGVWYSVPRSGEDSPDARKDAEAVAALFRQQGMKSGQAQPERHVNPWAKQP